MLSGGAGQASLGAVLVAAALLAGLVAVAQALVSGTVQDPPEKGDQGARPVRTVSLHVLRDAAGRLAGLEEVLTVQAAAPVPATALVVEVRLLHPDGEPLRWRLAAEDGVPAAADGALGSLAVTVLRDADASAAEEPPRLTKGDLVRLHATLGTPEGGAPMPAQPATFERALRAPGWAEDVLTAELSPSAAGRVPLAARP